MFKYILYLICFNLILIISAHSNDLNITSDNLEVNRINKTSIFSGNVYAFNKDLEIWADELIVIFSDGENSIEQINVTNEVKIRKLDITATSKAGIYYPSTDKINLFGNVEVLEKNNIVKCDELIVDINNSISIMKSNSSRRVEAYISNN